MAMEGSGCFVAWYDQVAGQEAEHDDWHTQEHMIERLAIPGFRRGRRYRAMEDGPRSCVIYEVVDPAVLSSDAYRARLDDPTPWSREVLPSFVAMNRTLCRVLGSHGHGMGGVLLTVRLSGAADGLLARLPGLARRRGLCGAHLLRGDAAASGQATREHALRGVADQVSDLVLLVEGYAADAVAEVQAELGGGLYRLDFTLAADEAARLWPGEVTVGPGVA